MGKKVKDEGLLDEWSHVVFQVDRIKIMWRLIKAEKTIWSIKKKKSQMSPSDGNKIADIKMNPW